MSPVRSAASVMTTPHPSRVRSSEKVAVRFKKTLLGRQVPPRPRREVLLDPSDSDGPHRTTFISTSTRTTVPPSPRAHSPPGHFL